MARGLKLDLVAEGVENRIQLSYLKSQGCREAQGFMFGKPVPEDEMMMLLERNPYAEIIRERDALASL